MAFNVIEYLKKGKVDFVFSLTSYDYDSIISYVRKDPDRKEIVKGFLKKLIDKHYYFCFAIIYDMDEYQKETIYILNKYLSFNYLTKEHLLNLLHNTTWGQKYILSHHSELEQRDEDTLKAIIEFTFEDIDNNYDLIEFFYLHENLHIRYLFMAYILEHHPNTINTIYDDFTKYLTSVTYKEYEQLTFIPTLMDIEDICNLAILAFKNLPDKNIWLSLKEYILSHYKENTLAGKLLKYDRIKTGESSYTFARNDEKINEFKKDADRLFNSSIDYQFTIYHHYADSVSKDLIDQFAKTINLFQKPDTDPKWDFTLSGIYSHNLGHKLQSYVEKYLDLSHSKETGYLSSGATLSCYRIGDYVIKLIKTKWSYEKIICPVVAGLEVQKYLSKSAQNIPTYVFSNFLHELTKLGYYSMDTLINGTCGNNCMLLDTYKDADTNRPENLPSWFKQYPLVLVDRDDVYRLENKYPKNRHGPCY